MVKKADINNHQMLDIIRSVVKDRNIPDDQQHMVEKKTSGRLGSMSCQINTLKEEVLLCTFDERANNYKQFPYFQQVHGMVSMCDYILFVEDEKELVAFSIDLKDSTDGPKQQTLRTKPFAEFIVNRIKVVVGEDVFSKPVRYRQIGVKTTCHKMPTMGYAKLAYDKDDYLVLPDYRHFYTRLMMDTETSAHMAAG